jgi:hypothetical protein
MRDPIEELANITLPETGPGRAPVGQVLEQVHRRGARLKRRRTALTAVAGFAVIGAVAAPLAVAATTGAEDTSERTVIAGPAAGAATDTVLTLEARDCEGCEFQLTQGLWDATAPSGATVWQSEEKTVHDGRVSFTLPKSRTRGLSITLEAPWEGQLAGPSTVVMGYRGHTDDADVSTQEAQQSKSASACWAGTDADAVTLRIATEQVETLGVHERVPGTRAFTYQAMNDVQPPMRDITDGVLTSPDNNICGPRP